MAGQLPAYRFPTNALLKMDGLGDALADIGKVRRGLEQRDYNRQQDTIAQATAEDNRRYQRGMDAKRMSMQEQQFKADQSYRAENMDMRRQEFGAQQEDRTQRMWHEREKRAAGLAQMARGNPELWQRFIASDAKLREVVPPDLINDPVAGADYIIGKVRGYQEPKANYEDKVIDGRVVRVTPDGSAQEIYSAPNGGQKPPTNYEWDPSSPGRAKPIPGGPADVVTGEQAARIGAMSEGLRYLDDVRSIAIGNEEQAPDLGMGIGSHLNFQFERGKVGEMRRKMAIGIEGILRAQTGAAATQDEIDRVLAQYLPRPEDTAATRKSKLDAYESILKRTISLATKGTTGSQLDAEVAARQRPNVQPVPPQMRTQAMREAQEAIARGADPAQVQARLREMGVQ